MNKEVEYALSVFSGTAETVSAFDNPESTRSSLITYLQKATNLAGKEGWSAEFFNSPGGDEYLNIINFYCAHRLFGTAGFPETAIYEMLAKWQNRNADMVHNVAERARKQGQKRVVVFVGANHRQIMYDGLLKTPNVTVSQLSSLK